MGPSLTQISETSDMHLPLQLFLFVDKRPGATEQIRQVRSHLKTLQSSHAFDLQVVDVGEQPYLAERFKLVATPALIKAHPAPQHILTGSNLVTQLKTWWPFWQQSAAEYLASQGQAQLDSTSITDSAQLMRLSEENFCLRQEQEALREQIRFKDQIVAMLVHDLRNPLTAVSMALETLEFSWSLEHQNTVTGLTPESRKQLMKHARNQAQIIEHMITEVLQASRGTSAELEIRPQRLQPKKLAKEIIGQLKNRLSAKSQQVKTDIPNDLPCVYADPERVRQVLVNLLDNAIKYTPAGGTIQVIISHRTTQKVQFSVCDNGPGIPIEYQKQIFDNQFRLQRDREQEGYGIGLALCQRVIRAHYGQLWVDSAPDQGSCFHFTLPVYRG